ncbi:hypothetical protein ACP4OV_008012 [Aristida adscensionis]
MSVPPDAALPGGACASGACLRRRGDEDGASGNFYVYDLVTRRPRRVLAELGMRDDLQVPSLSKDSSPRPCVVPRLRRPASRGGGATCLHLEGDDDRGGTREGRGHHSVTPSCTTARLPATGSSASPFAVVGRPFVSKDGAVGFDPSRDGGDYVDDEDGGGAEDEDSETGTSAEPSHAREVLDTCDQELDTMDGIPCDLDSAAVTRDDNRIPA